MVEGSQVVVFIKRENKEDLFRNGILMFPGLGSSYVATHVPYLQLLVHQ